MRCDGEPVRPGMRTTRRMSRASQPEKRMGPCPRIPSGPAVLYDRINRPDTRLHPDQNAKNTRVNPCNAGAHPHRTLNSQCRNDRDLPTRSLNRADRRQHRTCSIRASVYPNANYKGQAGYGSQRTANNFTSSLVPIALLRGPGCVHSGRWRVSAVRHETGLITWALWDSRVSRAENREGMRCGPQSR